MKFTNDVRDLAAELVALLQGHADRLTGETCITGTADTLHQACEHEDVAADIAGVFGLPGVFKLPDETLNDFAARKELAARYQGECTCTGPARPAHDKECPVRKRNPRIDLGDKPS